MLREETNRLLFFRPSRGSILNEMIEAEERCRSGMLDESEAAAAVLSVMKELIAFSLDKGIDGNLWENYLVSHMLTDENAYTLSRERKIPSEDSFSILAKDDFAIMRRLMDYDFEEFRKHVDDSLIEEILHFRNDARSSEHAGAAGEIISEVLSQLHDVKSDEAFKKVLDEQYFIRGTGEYAYNDAFRIADDDNDHRLFKPIRAIDEVTFADMVGYELQKGALIRNTLAFIEGRPANNVLLYGDSGSGKSTSIKALLNEYAHRGLRIIEVHKHQFKYISEIIGAIKNRNYRFILFIDDLSFEEFEIEYKYLKAVIEGDMEVKSDNILIYATSNRRHLIRETWSDKNDMTHNEDIHRSDTVEEKTSLSSRFGVTIYFPSPDRAEYHEIVRSLAEEAGIDMDEQELLVKADAWEIRHGGVSCRTARQFVDYLASAE